MLKLKINAEGTSMMFNMPDDYSAWANCPGSPFEDAPRQVCDECNREFDGDEMSENIDDVCLYCEEDES